MKQYGPCVRVVHVAAAPPSTDLQVQVRNAEGGWLVVAKFNDMSNDYAYTAAHERALQERRKLVEGEV